MSTLILIWGMTIAGNHVGYINGYNAAIKDVETSNIETKANLIDKQLIKAEIVYELKDLIAKTK